MPDRAKKPAEPHTAEKLFFELQVEQHHHDEIYHREIARLSLHQRLNHMALHFSKYTGKVAATKDPLALQAVYTDVLIIALSTANILNVKLYDLLEKDDHEFLGLRAFGCALALEMKDALVEHSELLKETAVAAGRMAAACEKIDHLEEISFRQEISHSIAQLSALALGFISSQGADPHHVVTDRLSSVKKRLKLHGRI